VVFIRATTAPAFAGKIIYVDDDAPADFNNIQAAINDSNDGDTIIVTKGRYFENINFNGRNITLTSTEPNDPNVVAATIIDGSRNGSVVTFHSGEDANCVLNGFTITNGYGRKGGGIYCGASSPTITNCIITGNSATWSGGMHNYNSSPKLTNCTFSGNSATWDGGMDNDQSSPILTNCTFIGNSAKWCGGMNNDQSDPILTNCTFSGNSAQYGGGMDNQDSSPTLKNCTFSENSADKIGGGIVNSRSSPILTGCTFSGNSAHRGGGGMINNESCPTLTNCTFSGNSAHRGGGGMSNNESCPTMTNCTFIGNFADTGGGMDNHKGNPTITNCIFSGNSATDDGGGMLNLESSPIVTNCIFIGNMAERLGGGMCNWSSSPTVTTCRFSGNSADSGSGIYNNESSPTLTYCTFSGNSSIDYGGGIRNERYSRPTLKNCTFSGNSANSGGGMENSFYSSPALTNCTFSQNSAQSGGGMNNKDGSSPTLTNCIFIGNYYSGMLNWFSSPILNNCTFTGNYNSGMHNYYASPTLTNCILWNNSNEILNDVNSTIKVTYSDVQSGWPGEGNIDAVPLFVDPGYWDANGTPDDANDDVWIDGDYHLLPGSPCLNAGDPSHLYDPNEIDLDGKPRLIGCRIDMGAFEYSNLIPAEVSIVPRTINLANKVKWITAILWLPENYNVSEIDFCILLLEDKIEPEQLFINEKEQVMMARFNHEQLHGILTIGEVELLITAQLTYGYAFEGTDVIRVIYEGGGKLAKYGKAGNPNPADGATDVGTTADLSWTADYGATSHDVYFGTANPPPFIGNQTATTFDPGKMDYETTYYWRIDEINKWGTATGDLWSFTTHGPPPPPGPGPGPKPPGSPPGCFPADTPVWVDGAQVQFSKITAGQKVGRLDATETESGFEKPVCLKEIESVLEYRGTYDYYNIVLETGNYINVVNTHYFLTDSDRWVLVQNLKAGSKLRSLKGPIRIKTISKSEEQFTGRLYNLKIKGGDRYFVGKDGVAVRGH
jgi:predicted enzyme related to lactoylglutathione lyase